MPKKAKRADWPATTAVLLTNKRHEAFEGLDNVFDKRAFAGQRALAPDTMLELAAIVRHQNSLGTPGVMRLYNNRDARVYLLHEECSRPEVFEKCCLALGLIRRQHWQSGLVTEPNQDVEYEEDDEIDYVDYHIDPRTLCRLGFERIARVPHTAEGDGMFGSFFDTTGDVWFYPNCAQPVYFVVPPHKRPPPSRPITVCMTEQRRSPHHPATRPPALAGLPRRACAPASALRCATSRAVSLIWLRPAHAVQTTARPSGNSAAVSRRRSLVPVDQWSKRPARLMARARSSDRDQSSLPSRSRKSSGMSSPRVLS